MCVCVCASVTYRLHILCAGFNYVLISLCLFVCVCARAFLHLGDPFLPHLEWQPEATALHLQPGEGQSGRLATNLQDLRATGGGRGSDLSAEH